jgi:hypothetical protein
MWYHVEVSNGLNAHSSGGIVGNREVKTVLVCNFCQVFAICLQFGRVCFYFCLWLFGLARVARRAVKMLMKAHVQNVDSLRKEIDSWSRSSLVPKFSVVWFAVFACFISTLSANGDLYSRKIALQIQHVSHVRCCKWSEQADAANAHPWFDLLSRNYMNLLWQKGDASQSRGTGELYGL